MKRYYAGKWACEATDGDFVTWLDAEKRIAELEAIVVQQRDGFFEQDNRIAELEAENETMRATLESQGRDHTLPCNLGTFCPWCHIDYMKAEIERLRSEVYDLSMAKSGIDLYGVKAENEAMKADAERWQKTERIGFWIVTDSHLGLKCFRNKFADKAIDAMEGE